MNCHNCNNGYHDDKGCTCSCHVDDLRREVERLRGANEGLKDLMFSILEASITKLLEIRDSSQRSETTADQLTQSQEKGEA